MSINRLIVRLFSPERILFRASYSTELNIDKETKSDAFHIETCNVKSKNKHGYTNITLFLI